jgi:hypothetical protein
MLYHSYARRIIKRRFLPGLELSGSSTFANSDNHYVMGLVRLDAPIRPQGWQIQLHASVLSFFWISGIRHCQCLVANKRARLTWLNTLRHVEQNMSGGDKIQVHTTQKEEPRPLRACNI